MASANGAESGLHPDCNPLCYVRQVQIDIRCTVSAISQHGFSPTEVDTGWLAVMHPRVCIPGVKGKRGRHDGAEPEQTVNGLGVDNGSRTTCPTAFVARGTMGRTTSVAQITGCINIRSGSWARQSCDDCDGEV